MNIGIVIGLIKALAPGVDPEVIEQAVIDWLDDHPEATTTVQDGSITEAKLAQDVLADLAEIPSLKEAIGKLDPSATSGDVGKFLKAKTVSGGKVTEWELGAAGGGGSVDLFYVTPEDYGAVGDGETDDSQAVQDAVDAGYAVYFGSNKTYYLASTVTIDHDCHLFGGENTVIKTATPESGTAPNGIVVTGTLKKTTTLTGNYSAVGSSTDNAGNRFELTDMTGINIGDIMVITAEDQYYNYNRQYYYLGGTLMIADKDENYLYACDAMPWDIENTEDVSVKVYSAPVAIIENLNFVSDIDTSGSYHYCLMLDWCKNSTVKNCTISEMDNGMRIWECVNTEVDCVNISVTPPISGGDDHYGISIYSSSNTIISRITSEAANSCVDLSGHTPNMNTYFRNCMLFGSNRVDGLGMHENAYNTVIEDSVIGGMIGYGTVNVQRCRFVQRNKVSDSNVAITFRGSHNADWSRLIVEDCVFEGNNLQVNIAKPVTQTPIQAYNHIIGEIWIRNCVGGRMFYNAGTDATILSNTINRIIMDNWRDCYEFYHTGNKIKSLLVNNCSFLFAPWCNKHADAFSTDGIENLRLMNMYPQEDKLFAEIGRGDTYFLPKDVPIVFTTSNASDHFAVCGKNIISNIATDYAVGDVSGSAGSALTRTVNNNFSSAVSTNANDELVFTQPSGFSAATATYPKCMIYVPKRSRVRMSATLKNTGATNAAAWRPFICIVDAATMNITYRGNGTGQTATAEGVTVTHYRDVPANSFVFCYMYCNSPVKSSETTFSNFVANIMTDDFIEDTVTFEKYDGSGRDGSGTLYSVDGINYIMANAAGSFTAKFKANLLE